MAGAFECRQIADDGIAYRMALRDGSDYSYLLFGIMDKARDGDAVGQLDAVYTAFLRKAALDTVRAHLNDSQDQMERHMVAGCLGWHGGFRLY
jgi:hypothetical protein